MFNTTNSFFVQWNGHVMFDNYASCMYIGNYQNALFSKTARVKLLSIFA